MKGFVPTPSGTVDTMVELLFRGRTPGADDTILDPGCGTGEFIDGVIRWCQQRQLPVPRIAGIELDPRHLPALRAKYAALPAVRIEQGDFLMEGGGTYRYIVGNPPYVPITAFTEAEKSRYRARYATARGLFDLYLLFFEEAVRQLAPGGRLVFITPEKYLYVESAGPLRELLARRRIVDIHLVREDTFGDLVTYPTITVVDQDAPGATQLIRRNGTSSTVNLPPGRDPWLPLLEGGALQCAPVTLSDLCSRVSCGVATGADSVFVRPANDIDPALLHFAHPTIAGRELAAVDLAPSFVMLIPYGVDARLLPFEQLGPLREYLLREDVRRRLIARTCVKA